MDVKNIQAVLVLVSVVGLSCFAMSCRGSSDRDTATGSRSMSRKTLDQHEAEGLALQCLKNEGLLPEKYTTTASLRDDEWWVTVEKVPKEIGAHWAVVVDESGNCQIHRGR